jgi:hypothetical protein
MLRLWLCRLAAATLIVLVSDTGRTEDCRFLMRDPLQLRDRQLFFRTQGASNWVALDEVQQDLANQTVEFAYVVRESIDPGRSGVVILKSGRARRLDEPSVGKNVLLVRRAEAFDNKKCGLVTDFGEREIPSVNYDRYHDEGRRVRERDTLRAFHFRYAARKSVCRATDDGTQDSIVPWDPRSNRSQFSFDPNVVSGGTYSQALAWVGVTKTYASSENFADQRVELKQYRVDVALPTCVRFQLSALGRRSFLRINDLEGLVAGGLNYVRANESNWTLAQ